MKIVVTGSTGHISKPLTDELVQNGHEVTVISSKFERTGEIENLGAKAAIGSLDDVEFLKNIFAGAYAVYSMVPPANYFDHNLDLLAYYHNIGNNYADAIRYSGVKKVVNLSTFGGDLEKGNGILRGAHDVEEILNKLPDDVSVTHIRPTSFFYNLYAYTNMIREAGMIAANYGAEDIIPWVSPSDIAAVVAEALVKPFMGRNARYIASEELTGSETAAILGAAIGKPDLQWILISDDQVQSGLEAIGMNPQIAAGMVEMYGSLHNGVLAEDYYCNKPAVMGKVKLTDFAKEFAARYHK